MVLRKVWLLLVVAAVLAGACAPATGSSSQKPTVRLGGQNFTEQTVLVELYGQALEAAGYQVERRANLGAREIVEPALESGQIDMYPEYLATAERFLSKDASKASTDAGETQKALQEAFKAKNITVLDHAPAVNQNGIVVSKATADRHNLKKVSDLAPVSNQLVFGGPPECPNRPFCIPGLERTYGVRFKEFKPLDIGGPLTVAALEGNQIDVGLLFTTDAAIPQKGFVLLDDDKKLQLADNVAPVVRDDLLNRAPADFKGIVNGVTAKLTTQELTDLNKQVGVDRREAREVAAAWLKAKGLVK